MKSKVIGILLPIKSDKRHQNQEIYDVNFCMCTIKATHYKDPPKVLIEGKDDE